ncbi:MAG: TonB-dependent receptor [Verrucomicrobia bacterium]|nr:TonB-dependent receptor [Verrucomicrobiota bacterium]
MNTPTKPRVLCRLTLLLWPALLGAQVAPAPSAETLRRYDANKNGRLDPDEIRALEADQKKVPSPATASTAPDEAVVLSPFEVVADTKGYFATNTMSGTRLNSPLDDLASPISVITKEQMADFAMLDLNDVFLYAANTEGTGTFTQIEETSGRAETADATAGDPANANRIRGIGRANVSSGNFETSNRVPLDPLDTDGVEISRGPNASIFGLGNPSGTVNIVGAAANLQRDRAQVSVRADSDEGHRATFDANRVLFRDRLAVRLSYARQRDGFDLKPSGVDSSRLNAMLTARPFKRTLIRASYQYYHAAGNRPNSIPPQDGVSDWRAAGSPTWDPITNALKLNGNVIASNPPAYTYVPTANYGQVYVEPQGITYWGQTYGANSTTTPFGALQNTRRVVVTAGRVQDNQPLIGRRTPLVTDRSIYDWKSLNTNAPNSFEDRTETTRITLDQTLFETGRQSLAAQFGWFREDSERYNRYIMSDGGTQGTTGQLAVDINERLLDGTPNPYLFRPFIFQAEPRVRNSPLTNDTYRLQSAYRLDFSRDQGLRRWLGAHSLVGYGEYKEKDSRVYTSREDIISINPWTFPNATGNRQGGQPIRGIFRFYVGDNRGQNIEYAPPPLRYGNYTYAWGNALTGQFNYEPITFGLAPLNSSGSHVLQKTEGALLQSQWLRGRVITTLGAREDRHYTKLTNAGNVAAALTNRGFDFNYAYINALRPDPWQIREGRAIQKGVVVKPFRGWAPIERLAAQGSAPARFVGQMLQGLNLHYNRSDSFLPASPAQDVFFKFLPDPSGQGEDYGFSLNLLDGRFSLRVNRYETMTLNSRNGPSNSLAGAALALDFFGNAGGVFYGLQVQATEWLTAANPSITPQQLEAQLTALMGIAPIDLEAFRTTARSETDDILSRGTEVELHFNPVNWFTLTSNFTEQQTINTRMGRNVGAYVQQRLPYWSSVVDPRTGQLWFDRMYTVNETQRAQFIRAVQGALQTAQALEGLARPQVRRYRGSLSTNVRLSGLTQRAVLRRFNVGGSLRYESQGSIGFYAAPPGADGIYRTYDVRRPVWDKGHVYADAFVGYRARLFANRVGATFQLNVRNVQESGRLQPIAALPDGSPYQYRIIAPRQFILSATFDL